MKNAMQLKALVKNLAAEKGAPAQTILQNYMLERLLERVSLSRFRSQFILKGGFLIAAIVGHDTRTTMDMDATLRGLPVSPESIRNIFGEICGIQIDDGISFRILNVRDIREDDIYGGVRLALAADFPPMAVKLKVDITSGDKITPREVEYQFPLLLEKRTIQVMAYNLETILAEKLETILSRGIYNTRPRDYYDVYILAKLQGDNISMESLLMALHATAEKRGTLAVVKDYASALAEIRADPQMNRQWLRYQAEYPYAAGIVFEDTCIAAEAVLKQSGIHNLNEVFSE